MFTVSLWSFAKDSNSTKQPTGNGTRFSCNILTPSDIIAPTVEISANDLTGYNYAYIPAFHRYYFIEGITFDSGLWRLALQCDVLATYKTTIGAQSLYILRSSAAYDGNIKDNLYPPTASYHYYIEDEIDAENVPPSYDYGYYIINTAGVQTGSSTLIQLTPSQFTHLLTNLYAAIGGYSLTDVVATVVKFFGGNPEKLVNSAMWVPFAATSSVSVADVKIGGWKSTDTPGLSAVPGEIITDPIREMDLITFTVRKHPQSATRGRYLNLAPYSNYTLYIPGCGACNLDTSELLAGTSINIQRTFDLMTGVVHALVSAGGSGHILADITGQWGVPINLSGNNNTGTIMTSAISTVGATATAIATGGISAVVGAAAGIGSIAGAVTGATINTGSHGSIAQFMDRKVRLETTFFDIAADSNAHFGKPLCQTRTPSSLGGFMIAQKGDIPISGTSTEADQIKQLLEGGFYYE